MTTKSENKIALLIDGDNAQSKFIESMLYEAGKNGKVTIRRIYADWTDNRLTGWKAQINKFSIRPMQKFAFAKGKNSTDTAMIIDAMDILHSKTVEGFCIASSDSDYTGLAQRIREEGVFVMGIGEAAKTTDAFVNACDIFIYTENLISPMNSKQEIEAENKKTVKQEKNQLNKTNEKVKNELKLPDSITLPQSKITLKPIDMLLLYNAVKMVSKDDGFAYMSEIVTAIRKLDPSFDSRTFGYASFSTLFKKLTDFFELTYRDNGSSLYIKIKSISK